MNTIVRRLASIAVLGGAAVGGSALASTFQYAQPYTADETWHTDHRPPPSRKAQLDSLRQGGFDVLVIGGACDAHTRKFHAVYE